MPLSKVLAQQLRKPSGWFGKMVMGRLLNRINDPMNVLMLDLLDVQPDDRVLEVGFGGGELLGRIALRLQGGTVEGIDFSPEMVAQANKRFRSLIEAGRMHLQCANAERLPFTEAQFTRLCTANTIYFWDDPTPVLVELHRVLIPGGKIVLGFSPKRELVKRPFTAYGFTLYKEAEVQRLLEAVGFRDVHLEGGRTGQQTFYCAVGIK